MGNIGNARRVTHKPAMFYEERPLIDRRNPILLAQCRELLSARYVKCIWADKKANMLPVSDLSKAAAICSSVLAFRTLISRPSDLAAASASDAITSALGFVGFINMAIVPP